MALGFFDDAELSIQQALSVDPDNKFFQLQLFEIYFVSSDKKKFERAGLEYSGQLRGEEEWKNVQEMASIVCPNSETFR